MSKPVVGAILLAVGLTLVPVTVQWRNHAKTPMLAVSKACAEGENCCLSFGDLCLLGGKILINYRPAGLSSCDIKPTF